MRKIVSGLFISLDGVVQDPHLWQGNFDEGMLPELGELFETTDTIVLGRVTYDEWMPYWTTATTDLDFAEHINGTPKYIVSNSLDKVEWGKWDNATLLKGNLAEAFQKMKAQDGKNIAVEGSPSLVKSLIEQEILDELTLYVHPVVVGKGNHLFNESSPLQRLKLTGTSRITEGGTAILRYEVVKTS